MSNLHDYRPEFNLAVALAAGFKARIFDFAAEGRRCIYENARGGGSCFEPYTDLNAAHEAADHIKLWNDCFLARFNDRWYMNRWRDDGEWENYCGPYRTASETICQAILQFASDK